MVATPAATPVICPVDDPTDTIVGALLAHIGLVPAVEVSLNTIEASVTHTLPGLFNIGDT